MHPRVEEAFEQIDAALFNGDTFDDPDAKKHLIDYLGRWLRKSEYPLELLLRDDKPSPEVEVKREDYLKLARQHIEGHDREKDEYNDCLRCNTTMETTDEPCAFCSDCMYQVADVLAEAVESLDACHSLAKNSREVNYAKRRELEALMPKGPELLSLKAALAEGHLNPRAEKVIKRLLEGTSD